MISYELAEHLYDKGFPVNWSAGKENFYDRVNGGAFECVYFPNLSELVEECKNGFESLRIQNGVWFANYDSISKEHRDIRGDSSEDAVAKLWLELNK